MMAAGDSAKESGVANPFQAASDKIREAAKWLIAATAAVGAAVIAGSQLSNIGSLPICMPTGIPWSPVWISCARLPIAVCAAAVALMSIAYMLWAAVRLLMPIGAPLGELAELWDKSVKTNNGKSMRKHWWRPLRGDIKFFVERPEQIPSSTGSLSGVKDEYETARDGVVNAAAALEEAQKALMSKRSAGASADELNVAEAEAETVRNAETVADEKLKAWNDAVLTVVETAGHELLAARFRVLLLKLAPAVLLAAVGLTAFAWASNPPDPQPQTVSLEAANLNGADLRNAKLVGVNLDGADLTNARLEGANLGDASLRDTIWTGATCPDGSKANENSASATCLGHLTP